MHYLEGALAQSALFDISPKCTNGGFSPKCTIRQIGVSGAKELGGAANHRLSPPAPNLLFSWPAPQAPNLLLFSVPPERLFLASSQNSTVLVAEDGKPGAPGAPGLSPEAPAALSVSHPDGIGCNAHTARFQPIAASCCY